MIRVIEFKTQYRAGKDPVDMVLVAPIGADFERTQTWQRVSKITPPSDIDDTAKESMSYKDMVARWSIVGPQYEAWRNGQELPDDGTPLGAWSGVTSDQATFLRSMGVRTVEEVAELGDASIEKLHFPDARRLPGMAKKWLAGEATTQKDAKIADMEEQMAAMKELLEEQMSANAPKKRGRPPKAEAKQDEVA